jgi:hypothetical protein
VQDVHRGDQREPVVFHGGVLAVKPPVEHVKRLRDGQVAVPERADVQHYQPGFEVRVRLALTASSAAGVAITEGAAGGLIHNAAE